MIKIFISENDEIKLKELSKNSYEVNGDINVSSDGKIQSINYQIGQRMKPCYTGCLLNFHTHPPDYANLYPDHPSAIDFKYIYNATCRNKELSAHLIVTPKFLYVVYYKCRNPLMQFFNFFSLNWRIEREFQRVGKIWDRSTENFRSEYLQGMSSLGFHIDRFAWGTPIVFYIPSRKIKITIYILFVFVCIFLLKKYIT